MVARALPQFAGPCSVSNGAPERRIWLSRNDDTFAAGSLRWGWGLWSSTTANLIAGMRPAPCPTGSWADGAGRQTAYGVDRSPGSLRAEVALNEHKRSPAYDFTGRDASGREVFIEVKNVHLRRGGDWAEFPDCVTARGTRHLEELASVAASGRRAVMLYLVQRTDCARFRLAADLDPAYARAFDVARAGGVEMLCFGTEIRRDGVWLGAPLPVDPSPQSAAG